MRFKHAVITTLALAGSAAAGVAQAQEPRISWSLTIGAPFMPVLVAPGYAVVPQPVYPAVQPGWQPVYGVAPGYAVIPGYGHAPRYDVPARDSWVPPRHAARPATRHDRDRDGIPNRYDRVYNPPWDRDGDGIVNRNGRNWNGNGGWYPQDRRGR